jgi:YfiH family protein
MTSLPLLTSAVIPAPFRHGFTTRRGGVSAPPFESLNLGMKWGDDPAAVLENRRRVLQASGASVIYSAAQVHGAAVVQVCAGDDPAAIASRQADAVCSDLPGLAVSVYVADCVPLLVVDPRTGAFAAVHAGWRGTVADVVGATVRAMHTAFGSRPDDLRAVLGPAIGACCFEVGPEVAEAFQAIGAAEAVVTERPDGRPHVDLRRCQRRQLEGAGLRPDHVDALDACTRCDPERRFFSYRGGAGKTGMQIGFVGRLEPP